MVAAVAEGVVLLVAAAALFETTSPVSGAQAG